MGDLDPALAEAWADADRRKNGFVRIIKITSGNFRLIRVDPSLVVILDDPTTYLDQLRGMVLDLPCSTCDAGPSETCMTAAGNRLSTFHVARSRPVYAAWRLGHRDGLVDALRRLVNDWDTPADELLRKHGGIR